MSSIWTVRNNFNLGEIDENTITSFDLPLNDSENTVSRLISGTLPAGLRLENNKILGTPFEVDRPITSKFVIRATRNQDLEDRTFFITVQGADDPVWITDAGRLPVGNNNVLFILDNSLIDFQLLATDADLPAGDTLEYRLTSGELPPGITLSRDGRLKGIVDPILAVDINVVSGNYDINPLDTLPFDFSGEVPPGSRIPRKLNREYFFTVTVYDNVSSVSRSFQILVVSDDFARADNTITKAADGVFTADFTFLRVPLWLTPSNLGVRRANNYLTIFLDAFDANTISGSLLYFLESLNDDGTPSEIPTGLFLDKTTGELAGRVSFQPTITRDYKFTVRAERVNDELGLFTVFGTFIEDTLGNKTDKVRIAKVPRSMIGEVNELEALIGRNVIIESKTYQIIEINQSNPNFDIIRFNRVLESFDEFKPLVVAKTAENTNFFFVDQLTETDRNFYFRRELRFNDQEVYLISDLFPYIEWEVFSGSNEPIRLASFEDTNFIEENLINLLESPKSRPSYIEVERNNFDQVIKIRMKIPSTSQHRNRSFILSLFKSDNEPVELLNIGEFDRIELDQPLTGSTAILTKERKISLAVTRAGTFSSTFSQVETELAFKKKTFTIRLLGNIDSKITWLTSSNLGTVFSNKISTLSVKAISSATGSLVRYQKTGGSLPAGLSLTQDGEIIGTVPNVGTKKSPGVLRIFDFDETKNKIDITSFDSRTTTFDREFKFTVLANDRFRFSGIEREFRIKIDDNENLIYSNIYIKPFLKKEQRQKFLNLIDDSAIFEPSLIYRSSDPNFGIQKDLKCLIFAGIETVNLESYVTAAAKNHRRKNFYLGELKTAVAKDPGSNEIVYEVVYVEIKDNRTPEISTQEKTDIKTKNKITVDSINYETQDDNSLSQAGIEGIEIGVNRTNKNQDYVLFNQKLVTNDGNDLNITENIELTTNTPETVSLEGKIIDSLVDKNLLPDRHRPKGNTIKADSIAVRIDQDSDNIRYLSNIDTMRRRLFDIKIDGRKIATNRDFLPLWMRTPQENDFNELGYVLALPLVYTLPGQSERIKRNILNSGFDFTQLNFDIDRYIIDNTADINRQQFILFANYQFNI